MTPRPSAAATPLRSVTDLLGFRPTDLGAITLVGITVLAILRGYLVPRQTLTDRIADKDARIAELVTERDTWRQAHAVSEEARREAQDQAAELLELSKVATHFFSALPRAREVNDADVAQPPATSL